ncbi:MAG: hypothetical protein VX239_02065, partial [Candidatus Thermoplasmatota archaeon]|nr:hypothetical protein [Candidatus Thermoplasmatota archaeon]
QGAAALQQGALLKPSIENFHTYLGNGFSHKVDGQDDCLPLALNALCGRPVFDTMRDFLCDCVRPSVKKSIEVVLQHYHSTGIVSVNLASVKFDIHKSQVGFPSCLVQLTRVLSYATRSAVTGAVDAGFVDLYNVGATHFLFREWLLESIGGFVD